MVIKNGKLLGYILALVAVFFWSLHALSIRHLVVYEEVSPFLLVFFRFFFWWLFLMLFCLAFVNKTDLKRFSDDKIFKDKFFILSVVFLVFTFIAFHGWLEYTFASDGMLLQSFYTVFVFIITLALFSHRLWEASNLRKLLIIIIAWSIWSSLILTNPPSEWMDRAWKTLWDILELISTVFLASYTVFNSELRKKFHSHNWLLITTAFLSVAAIVSLPFFIFNIDSLFPINNTKVLLIALISFWSTWIAYLLWFYAFKYLSAISMAIIFNITWIMTVIFEYLIYKHSSLVSWKLILWWILILASSIYIEYLNNKSKETKKISE